MLEGDPLTPADLANVVLTQRRRKTPLLLRPVMPVDGIRHIQCTIIGPNGTSVFVEDESVSVEGATASDYEAMFEFVAVARGPNCAFKFLFVRDATMVPPLCLDCEGEGLVQLWNGQIVQD